MKDWFFPLNHVLDFVSSNNISFFFKPWDSDQNSGWLVLGAKFSQYIWHIFHTLITIDTDFEVKKKNRIVGKNFKSVIQILIHAWLENLLMIFHVSEQICKDIYDTAKDPKKYFSGRVTKRICLAGLECETVARQIIFLTIWLLFVSFLSPFFLCSCNSSYIKYLLILSFSLSLSLSQPLSLSLSSVKVCLPCLSAKSDSVY